MKPNAQQKAEIREKKKEYNQLYNQWMYRNNEDYRKKTIARIKKYKFKNYIKCKKGIKSLGQLVTRLEEELGIK